MEMDALLIKIECHQTMIRKFLFGCIFAANFLRYKVALPNLEKNPCLNFHRAFRKIHAYPSFEHYSLHCVQKLCDRLERLISGASSQLSLPKTVKCGSLFLLHQVHASPACIKFTYIIDKKEAHVIY